MLTEPILKILQVITSKLLHIQYLHYNVLTYFYTRETLTLYQLQFILLLTRVRKGPGQSNVVRTTGCKDVCLGMATVTVSQHPTRKPGKALLYYLALYNTIVKTTGDTRYLTLWVFNLRKNIPQ